MAAFEFRSRTRLPDWPLVSTVDVEGIVSKGKANSNELEDLQAASDMLMDADIREDEVLYVAQIQIFGMDRILTAPLFNRRTLRLKIISTE